MKQLTSILFILLSMNIYGQEDTINKNSTGRNINITLTPKPIGGRPDVMLVYKDSQIKLDSITLKKIDPKWIRSFKVVKEKDAKSIHGDVNGTILIYPKRKYHDQIQAILNE